MAKKKSFFIFFSYCSFITFSAFGVKIEKKGREVDLEVKGVRGMNKACDYARSLIRKAKKKEAVNVLIEAYGEYSNESKNVKNDDRAQRSWPYLNNAINSYIRYDINKPDSHQSIGFKNTVSEEVNQAVKMVQNNK